MYACFWYIEHWKGKSRRLRPNLEDYIDGDKSVVLKLKGPKEYSWWITHDVVNLVQHVRTEPLGGVSAEMGEVSCALPASGNLFNWFAKRTKNGASFGFGHKNTMLGGKFRDVACLDEWRRHLSRASFVRKLDNFFESSVYAERDPGTLPPPSPFGSATPRRDSLRSAPSPASVSNVPIFPETPDYGSHAYDAFFAEMGPRLAYEMEVISKNPAFEVWRNLGDIDEEEELDHMMGTLSVPDFMSNI
jgi:hypothetical protein